MPLTFAHPAAVLPLLRSPLNAVGLIAGAMAPDMPYFLAATGIPVGAQSWYESLMNATTTHTIAGAASVGVAIGLALWGLFWLTRAPLAALLPDAWAGATGPVAVAPPPTSSRSRFVSVAWLLASVLIGLATHLIWDSFTHGEIAARLPGLDAIAYGTLTWARVLQHASTAVGLLAIAVFLWRRRARLPLVEDRRFGQLWWRAAVVLAVALAGAVVKTRVWWSGTQGMVTADVVEGVLADAVKGAGVALVVTAVTYSAAWRILRTARAPRAANMRRPA